MNWPNRYVGIPFCDTPGGEGLNCWQLVREVLDQEAGLALPRYGETSAKDLAAVAFVMMAQRQGDPWIAVPLVQSKAFDLVLMKGRVRIEGKLQLQPNHIGIMVDDMHVLHVEERTSSVIVPIYHPTVQHRIDSVYRHKSLA